MHNNPYDKNHDNDTKISANTSNSALKSNPLFQMRINADKVESSANPNTILRSSRKDKPIPAAPPARLTSSFTSPSPTSPIPQESKKTDDKSKSAFINESPSQGMEQMDIVTQTKAISFFLQEGLNKEEGKQNKEALTSYLKCLGLISQNLLTQMEIGPKFEPSARIPNPNSLIFFAKQCCDRSQLIISENLNDLFHLEQYLPKISSGSPAVVPPSVHNNSKQTIFSRSPTASTTSSKINSSNGPPSPACSPSPTFVPQTSSNSLFLNNRSQQMSPSPLSLSPSFEQSKQYSNLKTSTKFRNPSPPPKPTHEHVEPLKWREFQNLEPKDGVVSLSDFEKKMGTVQKKTKFSELLFTIFCTTPENKKIGAFFFGNYVEAMKILTSGSLQERISLSYKLFDRNEKGYISITDFFTNLNIIFHILCQIGFDYSSDEWRAAHFLKLFNEFEQNTQKKSISKEQFFKTLSNEKRHAKMCSLGLFIINSEGFEKAMLLDLPRSPGQSPVSFFSPSFERVINLMIGISKNFFF